MHPDSEAHQTTTTKPGLDIILCCHNSTPRLPVTLSHIAQQKGVDSDTWGVILVDNASTDATADAARRIWEMLGGPTTLTIVTEERLGLAHARIKGIASSAREFMCFVDDDNWICEHWVANALATFARDDSIGAVGGRCKGAYETPPPAWFSAAAAGYAIGDQAEQSGDITGARGYLWGAGLCLRRGAIEGLLNEGFEFRHVGRAGNELSSGDDQELCLAMRLSGWRIWYNTNMTLSHFMPTSRLDWSYARKLFRAHGYSSPVLECYRAAYTSPGTKSSRSARLWLTADAVWSIFKYLLLNPQALWRHDIDALGLDSRVGRFIGIVQQGALLGPLRDTIAIATWNKHGVRGLRG
jgi:GT2 family glycosyltransferase